MKLLLPICLVAFVALCFGQSNQAAKPDLSGTWEFDAAHSNIKQAKNTSPEQIKITHHDPELIVRRKVSINGVPEPRDLVYYTDGRGETNPATSWVTAEPGSEAARPKDTTSKTVWSKDKVVTRSVNRTYAHATVVEFDIIDEWRLSSDGQSLTHKTTTIPRKDLTGNAVFVGSGVDLKAVYKLISK